MIYPVATRRLDNKTVCEYRLDEKNVKERKTKLARLDRAIQDKQAANAHLLKVSTTSLNRTYVTTRTQVLLAGMFTACSA